MIGGLLQTKIQRLINELVMKVRHVELAQAPDRLLDVARVVELLYELANLVRQLFHSQEAALVAPCVRQLIQVIVHVDE